MSTKKLVTTAAGISLAVMSLSPVVAMAADGAALYQSKTCFACHGVDAKTTIMPAYPKLAGQNKDYVLQQMKDIKSGTRKNGQSAAMMSVMSMVDDTEMDAIAEWLASLSRDAASSDAAAEGAKLYESKTCTACHGKDAQTPLLPNYPKLTGQNHEYALAQMQDIKSGARANGQSAGMKGVMGLVNDDEMKAIAEWLASSK